MPARLKRNPALLLGFLTAVAVFGFSTDHAAARALGCGDTVKADVKLKADLVNCSNNGLVVGADGIDIDLNGHTIAGDSKEHHPCPDGICDFGVAIAGHAGADRGRRARDRFGLGVGVLDSRDVAVRRVQANRNTFSGIVFFQVAGGAVRASTANRDGLDTDQAGMSMLQSHDVRVVRNTFARNGDIGLYTETNARIRIAGNRIKNNPEAGMFAVGGSKRVAIRDNRISHVGDGIIVDASHSRIARNRISGIEAPAGCPKDACAAGIAIEGARDNRVVRNRVSQADGPGIRLGVAPRFVRSNFRTRDGLVRANLLVGNGDGILVERNAVDSVLAENRARRNRGDGIEVRRPATTLTDNRANRNGHLGIDAVTNVRDGGGNRARDNGNPLQCVGLLCM